MDPCFRRGAEKEAFVIPALSIRHLRALLPLSALSTRHPRSPSAIRALHSSSPRRRGSTAVGSERGALDPRLRGDDGKGRG